jgi:hypothetical protein
MIITESELQIGKKIKVLLPYFLTEPREETVDFSGQFWPSAEAASVGGGPSELRRKVSVNGKEGQRTLGQRRTLHILHI